MNNKCFKIYDITKDKVIYRFDNLYELLKFLAIYQNDPCNWFAYRAGTEKINGYGNVFLDNVNVTLKDMKCDSVLYGEREYVIRPYVFIDNEDNIFDPRIYITEIIKLISTLYRFSRYYKYYNPENKSSKDKIVSFRNGPIKGTGCKYRGKYYIHPKIMNETRKSVISEHIEFIRPKRRYKHLPNLWYDEKVRHIDKSWKSQSKKKNNGCEKI